MPIRERFWVTGEDLPSEPLDGAAGRQAEVQHSRNYVWNGAAWARMTQPAGGGGGGTTSTTATRSSVAGSASAVTLLALNGSRVGAAISNDSTAILYLALGSSASTTSFTIKLFPDDYYEVPAGYTGIITGIWASATGSARITELT